MITAPCRVCGVLVRNTSLDDLYCGDACRTLAATRAASPHPGDPNYHAQTAEQRAVHRKAQRAKQWA